MFYVYYLESENYCKIGFTRSLKRRIDALNESCRYSGVNEVFELKCLKSCSSYHEMRTKETYLKKSFTDRFDKYKGVKFQGYTEVYRKTNTTFDRFLEITEGVAGNVILLDYHIFYKKVYPPLYYKDEQEDIVEWLIKENGLSKFSKGHLSYVISCLVANICKYDCDYITFYAKPPYKISLFTDNQIKYLMQYLESLGCVKGNIIAVKHPEFLKFIERFSREGLCETNVIRQRVTARNMRKHLEKKSLYNYYFLTYYVENLKEFVFNASPKLKEDIESAIADVNNRKRGNFRRKRGVDDE